MAADNQALVPEPTAEQQRVLDRIAMQRERIRARRVARAQSMALAQSAQQASSDEPFALRAAAFAKQHPVAVAALAGVALVAGPRRLVRWVGLAMPLITRLRPFLARGG
ncbi:hypothetical protein PMI14_01009 [Acidovorax sp. CF316]|uniref:hypothetical protein n=1 Tax=Acidovorax sp. CF316 TaxID=1144317 RepID=UPI00026BC28F|nr:hypothetical protein [Acidovorax sp. CF316]EJE54092.1 hypothetical protein PMI14_01009 [Acidovorax sp. CF316]